MEKYVCDEIVQSIYKWYLKNPETGNTRPRYDWGDWGDWGEWGDRGDQGDRGIGQWGSGKWVSPAFTKYMVCIV